MSMINLLPDSFRIKSSTVKTAEVLKKVSIILFVLFVVSVAVSTGLFFTYKNRVTEAKERQSSLERQIKALEETEQRLILVKDRLTKVENINKIGSTEEEIEGLDIIVSNPDLSIRINSVESDGSTLSMQIASINTEDTFRFVDFLKDSNEFSKATINSFEYRPERGVITHVVLNKK